MRVLVPMVAVLFSGGALLADAAGEIAAERTGEQIVKAQCAGCHEKGLHGAPRIEDRAAWIPRLKNGLDATVRSAIKGHGAMPSRGGMPDLTDSELRSAVVYLFNPAGPPPKPAPPPPLAANQRIVDGTEIFLGVKPVGEGLYHVTITLRDSTSHAAIDNAQVEVKVTNPVMGADARKLDREKVGAIVSYANDFRMSGKEPHVITVQVRRPGSLKVIETRFDFRG